MAATCSYCVSADVAEARTVVGRTPLVSADAPEAGMAAGSTWTHISVRSINYNYQRTDFNFLLVKMSCFFTIPSDRKAITSFLVIPGHG